MEIKMLTSIVGGVDLQAGHVGVVDDALGQELVKAGYAEQITPSKAPHQTTEKPASPAAKAEKRG